MHPASDINGLYSNLKASPAAYRELNAERRREEESGIGWVLLFEIHRAISPPAKLPKEK